MSLDDKIANGETELQQAYATIDAEITAKESQVSRLQDEIVHLKDRRLVCHRRAAEQGYPNLFI